VKVTALCPGRTESEFFEVAHAGAFKGNHMPTAEDVARLAVMALKRGQRTFIPYYRGRFRAFLIRFLPVGLITRYVEKAARPA
ncbi:MAG TPA: hypothetical protein VKF63_05850, partial [Terracidiphilus sp.]|nr:hypothetical protein [Terracidiphilus sp.]